MEPAGDKLDQALPSLWSEAIAQKAFEYFVEIHQKSYEKFEYTIDMVRIVTSLLHLV